MTTRLPRTVAWHPLTTDQGELCPALKARMVGKSGVYVIRKRGARRASYVGMSETGALWKTMIRHFHGCKSFAWANSRDGEKTEWCLSRGRARYVVAFFVTGSPGRTTRTEDGLMINPAARPLETRAIRRYQPTWNIRQEMKALEKEIGF